MASNLVTTTWKKDLTFESDNPNNITFLMEPSKDNGNKKEGASPKALMLSSLAGCSGLDVVSILEKMRVELDSFKIEVEGQLTDEHPKFYNKVHVKYHFYGADLKEAKINKAVNLSVTTYCGVMEMFRQFAEVTTEVVLHNS